MSSTTPPRTNKEPVKERRQSSRRQPPDVDALLLRCATIERRLEGIDAVLNIQAQRISTLQEEMDHLATRRRR